MTARTYLLPLAALLLSACGEREVAESAGEAPAPAAPTLESRTARLQASSPEIVAEDLADRIAILADDRFEGRAPGTEAGEAAAQWIADEMARIGLQPAFGDSYFQSVPLIAAELDPQSTFTVAGPAGEIPLSRPDNAVFNSSRLQPDVSFADSPVVFAGYGAVAPEYDWNDYEGFDPAGKTVIVLINDPGFATGDPELFAGEAMTYHGRWTYKYEEAGRQGATAVLIVHETAPAAYGWDVVRNSWSGAQYYLASDAPRPMAEGWITADKAREIFAAAGQDFDALKAAAAQRGFAPVALEGVTASAHIVSRISQTESRNVGGVIPGAERPQESVLYMAHWDHLGVEPSAAPGEDAIYNGAQDNATGVAAILEIGERFAAQTPAPARSVMLLAVTGEESGLLGSDYFAANPPGPLADIAAVVNFDALPARAPARDMIVIGYGASELEDSLRGLVAAEGRVLGPDPNPEAGYFYRSDHISLAKRGVPALYAKGGQDLVEGGPEAGAADEADYRAARYHGVADEYDESWDLRGMVADIDILYRLGADLAQSAAWPNWYPGAEFRALRDAQRPDGEAP